MNQIFLIGRITKDPELKYTPSSTAVTNITIAVDRQVKAGEEKKADFIRVTVFGRQAESVCRYLEKGRQVAIQGRIQTGSYEKNGEKRHTTDVIAERVEFIGNGDKSSQNAKYDRTEAYQQQTHIADNRQERMDLTQYTDDLPDAFAAVDDEIPF